jgi:hypothetical protein
MSPSLFAELYAAIDAVIAKESEEGRRTFWVYTDMVADMAHAARVIYDVAEKSSDFTSEQHLTY